MTTSGSRSRATAIASTPLPVDDGFELLAFEIAGHYFGQGEFVVDDQRAVSLLRSQRAQVVVLHVHMVPAGAPVTRYG